MTIPGTSAEREGREYTRLMQRRLLAENATSEADDHLRLAILLGLVRSAFSEKQNAQLDDSKAIRRLTRFEKERFVPRVLLAPDATWRYDDDAEAPDADWFDPQYDDTAWREGTGPFGFGDSREKTRFREGHLAYYVRTRFEVDAPDALAGGLVLEYARDDGVVFYLNGVEVLRDNVLFGAATHMTRAESLMSGSGETRRHRLTTAALRSALRRGTNVLAASIHQQQESSSDVHFEAELRAEFTVTAHLASLRGETVDAALDAVSEYFPPNALDETFASVRFMLDPRDLPSDHSLAAQPLEWRRRARFARHVGYADAAADAYERALELVRAQNQLDEHVVNSLDQEARSYLERQGHLGTLQQLDQRWALETLGRDRALRVNAGGGPYVDVDETRWSSDRCFSGGRRIATGGLRPKYSLPNTDQDPLFLSERVFDASSETLGYSFPVPPGRYRIRLHFMELEFSGGGRRSQDVFVAGEPFLENFDVSAAAGGELEPVVRETIADVTSSPLTIEFSAKKETAQVCAIEILLED